MEITVVKKYRAADGMEFATNQGAKRHNCQMENKGSITKLFSDGDGAVEVVEIILSNAEYISTALKVFLPVKVRVKREKK